MPQVSIIIPTHNGEQFLGQTIDSALAQTYRDFEVIVVNDGSTDGTAAILAGYGNRIKTIAQPNQGPSAARNTGYRATQGQYLLFLDDDDIIPPHKLAQQLPVLAQAGFGMVYSAWECVSHPDRQRLAEYRFNKQGNLLKELLLRTFFCIPGAAIIKRDCLEQTGLFDESLRAAEDTDWWCRCALLGYEFGYVDQILLSYRIRDNSLTSQIVHQAASELVRLDKFFAAPHLPAEIAALKSRAYAIIHFDTAARYFQTGQIELGQAALADAITTCPALAADETWLLTWLTSFATHYFTRDSAEFLRQLFANLPPQATTLAGLQKRAFGRYHLAAVFTEYGRGRLAQVRPHLWPAVAAQPAMLRNRGFISISLKSLLGPLFSP